MSKDKGYKTCTSLQNLTFQIIKEWHRETKRSEILLVRRQTFLRCPLTDVLVSEKRCHNCQHNYGDASRRDVYCVPATDRLTGVRTQRKTKEIDRIVVQKDEYITIEEP